MSDHLPTVAIIGAGSSGIAGAKVLYERGVPIDVYEASDRVGGNWVFGNRNGMSSSYSTLHINTSRRRMEYSDFPMPESYPDYPRHDQIAAYFDAYVDHFGFRDRIRFETSVQRAHRRPDGLWELTTDAGESAHYDALIVANGHHWDARWPEPAFPGHDTFSGEQIHAHDYKGPEQLRGRKVVVLGMGNSAMDIAVDASYVADEVGLAARRGAYVIPKYIFGRPIDARPVDPRIPWRIRQAMLALMFRLSTGEMEKYGLPRPDHRIGDAHPTISGRILDRIAHGTITPRPNIARLDGDRVQFEDGSSVEADLVVYCTGYKISFPFFDEQLISAPDNDLPLFRRVFHPEIDNVFFLSLLQPIGATMPLAERQGQWIADHLRGSYHLPAKAALVSDIERERARMFKRYVKSKRHTMQIDFEEYMRATDREQERGAARARRAGFTLPVPPRAAALEGEPLSSRAR